MNHNQLTFDAKEFKIIQSFELLSPTKEHPESGCIHKGRPVNLGGAIRFVCDQCKRMVKPVKN